MYKCVICEAYFPSEVHCEGGVCEECIPRSPICIEDEIAKSCEMLQWCVIDLKHIFICVLVSYDSANITKCILGGFGSVTIKEKREKCGLKEITFVCENEEYAYHLLLKIKCTIKQNMIKGGYKYNKYCDEFILRGYCNEVKCDKLHEIIRDRRVTLSSQEDKEESAKAIMSNIKMTNEVFSNTSIYTSLITKPRRDVRVNYNWEKEYNLDSVYPTPYDSSC